MQLFVHEMKILRVGLERLICTKASSEAEFM